MKPKPISAFSPGKVILGSIITAILIGTILLALPCAQINPIPFIDVLFTATSATCVTGLFTIPLTQFTPFGQMVLLGLVQIGGIGIITLSLLFMSLFMNFGLMAQLMAGKLLELETWNNFRRVLFFIIAITITFELIGTLCIIPLLTPLLIPLSPGHSEGAHIWMHALFYAVSSFCNAGISPLPNPHMPLQSSHLLMNICSVLIFAGGLGFITWYELWQALIAYKNGKPYRFSLHSKIIFYGSFALITLSTILIWILEREHTLLTVNALYVPLTCLFHALSFRGNGFSTVPIGLFQPATCFIIGFLAFIGSAPGSTGSGIKITTLTAFIATIQAALTGKTAVTLHGRELPLDQIFKAISIITLSLSWIALTTFCLLITDSAHPLGALLFEATSALTNLGLSTGITPLLSEVGKWLIIVSMIVGRIGSFTLVLALLKTRRESVEFSYPQERIILG